MNTTDENSAVVCRHLLDLDGPEPALIGSRCGECGEPYFPAATGCTRCRATVMEPCSFGSTGVLWSWTVQGFLPKSPYNGGESETEFEPYGVGYVEMPGGIKIESRLTVADPALLRIGTPMRLVLQPYGAAAGQRPVTFAFAPIEESST